MKSEETYKLQKIIKEMKEMKNMVEKDCHDRDDCRYSKLAYDNPICNKCSARIVSLKLRDIINALEKVIS